MQQKQLFDKFCVLRQKYDHVKTYLCDVLWEVIPSGCIPGVEGKGSRWLEAIPPIDHDVIESPTRIGNYIIGDILGEGQFASVHAINTCFSTKPENFEKAAASSLKDEHVLECTEIKDSSPLQRAVKMIDKARVVSLTTLRRVDNEIAVLRLLHHEGVMKLHEVSQNSAST